MEPKLCFCYIESLLQISAVFIVAKVFNSKIMQSLSKSDAILLQCGVQRRIQNSDVFCSCVWGNGVIQVQKIITTIYKKSMNKCYFQIITRFPYKPPRRNTRPSDITASSQLKINLVASILLLIYMS